MEPLHYVLIIAGSVLGIVIILWLRSRSDRNNAYLGPRPQKRDGNGTIATIAPEPEEVADEPDFESEFDAAESFEEMAEVLDSYADDEIDDVVWERAVRKALAAVTIREEAAQLFDFGPEDSELELDIVKRELELCRYVTEAVDLVDSFELRSELWYLSVLRVAELINAGAAYDLEEEETE